MIAASKRLEEENHILETQCIFWKKECERQKAEIDELNAFLTDLENETELKSMLGKTRLVWSGVVRA